MIIAQVLPCFKKPVVAAGWKAIKLQWTICPRYAACKELGIAQGPPTPQGSPSLKHPILPSPPKATKIIQRNFEKCKCPLLTAL